MRRERCLQCIVLRLRRGACRNSTEKEGRGIYTVQRGFNGLGSGVCRLFQRDWCLSRTVVAIGVCSGLQASRCNRPDALRHRRFNGRKRLWREISGLLAINLSCQKIKISKDSEVRCSKILNLVGPRKSFGRYLSYSQWVSRKFGRDPGIKTEDWVNHVLLLVRPTVKRITDLYI